MNTHQVNISYDGLRVASIKLISGFFTLDVSVDVDVDVEDPKIQLLSDLLHEIRRFGRLELGTRGWVLAAFELPEHLVEELCRFAQDFIGGLDASMAISAEKTIYLRG